MSRSLRLCLLSIPKTQEKRTELWALVPFLAVCLEKGGLHDETEVAHPLAPRERTRFVDHYQ
jgi:hypothetical protein